MLRKNDSFRTLFTRHGADITTLNVVLTLNVEEPKTLVPQHDRWIIGDDPANREVFEAGINTAVRWGNGKDNVDIAACNELGIPGFAIADLDFALTHTAHLPEPEALAPSLLEAKQQLGAQTQADPLVLRAVNDLPRKPQTNVTPREQGYKPSETVKRSAATPADTATAGQLAERLRDHGVWLWREVTLKVTLAWVIKTRWHVISLWRTFAAADDRRVCVGDVETADAFLR